MYYSNKLDALATFFGETVVYDGAQLRLPLSGKVYPIKNDVIVCDISLSSESNDIQTSFGEEWQKI